MTETEKKNIIKQVYESPDGLGSMQKTYQKAKQKLDSITQKDVKDWFDRNVEKKTKMRGWNSYIAPGVCDEFEMDVFEMPKDYPGAKEFPMGLLAIDIFSQYMSIIPLKDKTGASLKPAIEETVKKMVVSPASFTRMTKEG